MFESVKAITDLLGWKELGNSYRDRERFNWHYVVDNTDVYNNGNLSRLLTVKEVIVSIITEDRVQSL